MTSTVKLAGEIQPGDVILVEGFDSHGMSTTFHFPVTAVRRFTRKVRIHCKDDTRTFSLSVTTQLRVQA